LKDIREKEKENSVNKLRERKERKAMMGSEAILCVLVVHLLLAAESLVISPRWSHLRWKTVAPARVDVRASGQVIFHLDGGGNLSSKTETSFLDTNESALDSQTSP